ncbi:Transcriptional regulator, TetR family [Alloactinosynnema sp. L-07]|uniref:TetR/AcrR family transcriptional regulator n=1 Tax=Alloactinosynnema sp. L-07 TaxID=1653480 RepID=UPI00065F0942|nr:TetR/AcrR family transcriptional regulator [Alloactinosynnema sp. L-07]CRK61003.1 Transcriptional regulator, TetR family [Alloactinosynnema sp. L-07]
MPRKPQKRSEATRATLLRVARELFADRGYSAVTAEDIVSAAELTRGALHHQFGDKRGLFRELLLVVEAELVAEIRAAVSAQQGPPEQMVAAMNVFLDACTRPEVSRIALLDAPVVLGWTQWRAIEADYGLQVIIELLEAGMDAGFIQRQPAPPLAQIILSALIESALLIAHADDKPATRATVSHALGLLLSGLLTP